MKSFSEVKSNLFLGHTRYSTSDLKVNQPLSRSGVSIAHNGVITQLPKGEWKKEYGYETETDNDSELLLRCILDGEFDEVQDKFKGSSISVGILNKGGLYFFRNGQRPLWKIEIKKEGEVKVIVFCSTQSIFLRALKNTEVLPTSYLNGTNLVIEETQPGVIYVALPKRNCVKTKDFTIANIIKDLQNERL